MKSLLVPIFCISVLIAKSQNKNQFYALDAGMNQTVLDSSKYILWIHENDSAGWQWDYYYTWGSLVKSTNYADHDGTLKNGRFCIYNPFGNLDSTGVYENNKKNGLFLKLRSITKDSIEFLRQYEYKQDSLVRITNLISEKGKQTDTSRQLESEFPGGQSEWLTYLTNNLRYPERAQKKDIQGRIRLCFLVDTAGIVTDPFIIKSVEYSLDQESIKLIKNSGKWIPAQKDGIPVAIYKNKTINYTLENQ